MSIVRIALANVRPPASRDDSVALATDAIRRAGNEGAAVVCFPEAFVPGYRKPGETAAAADAKFLEAAWTTLGEAAGQAGVTAVVGTERVVGGALRISAVVLGPDGSRLGFQDKVQLDPSEEPTYAPGEAREMFTAGPLTFGIAICHEGFRYPETVRWHARRGAHVVFHPHYHWADADSFRPSEFGDPRNTFHEKALVCRAAENTCYIASVNCASEGSGTTSFVVRPDGTVQKWQPYGVEGLLVAEIDTDLATGLLASRFRDPIQA